MIPQRIFSGLSVSILDDNPYYARLLERQLRLYIDDRFSPFRELIRLYSFSEYDRFLHEFPSSPTLALVDYYLGNGKTGVDLLQPLREKKECRNVIILTTEENLHVVPDCVENGAGGVIFKSEETISLCALAIRNAMNNCIFH